MRGAHRARRGGRRLTIGGVVAPRHARTVDEILAHAQESLEYRQDEAARLVRSLSADVRARRGGATMSRQPTRSSPRSTSGASCSPSSRSSRPRRAAVPSRMPDAHRRAPTAPCLSASAVIPIAEKLGLVRLIDHRVLELATAELAAGSRRCARASTSRPTSTIDPDWWAGSERGRAPIPASRSA